MELPIIAYWGLVGAAIGIGAVLVSSRRAGLWSIAPIVLGAGGGILTGFLGREIFSIGTRGQFTTSLAVAAAGAAILLIIHGMIASK